MGYDELRRLTEALRALRGPVEEELRRRVQGLRGVGVGVRTRRGELTGEPAFRVYLDRKLPRGWLAASEVVPPFIAGYSTDVHVLGVSRRECTTGVRPVVAGVQIESDSSQANGSEGTLGCFVTLPAPSNQLAGITCEHVLHSTTVTGALRVYQPAKRDSLGFGPWNQVGEAVQGAGIIDEITFNNDKYFVDCAALTFKGVGVQNRLFAPKRVGQSGLQTITAPNVPGSVVVNSDGQVVQLIDGSSKTVDTTSIMGSGPATMNTLVFKVGRSTGLTVGVVVDADGPATFEEVGTGGAGLFGGTPASWNVKHQVLVQPLAGFAQNGVASFTLPGDSGSAYLDLANKVVALHHHGGTVNNTPQSFGAQIAAVLFQLGTNSAVGGTTSATVRVNDPSTTVPTAAPSNALAAELWGESPPQAHDYDRIREDMFRQLSGSAGGELLLEFIETHLTEVLRLIFQCRPVTIVWHRHHGPAFVALFARALASPELPFPNEAGGVSRRALLEAMAGALVAYGNGELRAYMKRAAPMLLDLLANARSLGDLCERLARAAA